MTVFISGGAKCGKSTLAQNLAVALADGGKHYYVATMISSGKEDDERIRRHIADRDGMGFQTVECFRNILDCLETTDADGVFLVDSVTALVQNALFPVEKNYEMDLAGAERCGDELVEFAKKVRHVVYVSDYIYSDAERYSESTEAYRKALEGAVYNAVARPCKDLADVSEKLVIYDRIELIHPDRRSEMIEDLKQRLGLDIIRVEVGAVDFLRDTAMIKIYYEGEGPSNTVNHLLKFPKENK